MQLLQTAHQLPELPDLEAECLIRLVAKLQCCFANLRVGSKQQANPSTIRNAPNPKPATPSFLEADM